MNPDAALTALNLFLLRKKKVTLMARWSKGSKTRSWSMAYKKLDEIMDETYRTPLEPSHGCLTSALRVCMARLMARRGSMGLRKTTARLNRHIIEQQCFHAFFAHLPVWECLTSQASNHNEESCQNGVWMCSKWEIYNSKKKSPSVIMLWCCRIYSAASLVDTKTSARWH